MPDPALHGNGTTCPTCAGAGRVWRAEGDPGRRYVRCPDRCAGGRIALTPAEIVAEALSPREIRSGDAVCGR